MPRSLSKIDKMSGDEIKDLKHRLHSFQGGECFLCGRPINLEADETEIDHIVPLADKGPDEEANWALLHSVCNDRKSAQNLNLARILMRFENTKEEYGGALTTAQVLEMHGGSTQQLHVDDRGDSVLVRYECRGSIKEIEAPIIVDPNNLNYRSFFIELPIEVLHHDFELNPRKIINADKLIKEFWRKNPQLHVALCRLQIDTEAKKGDVLLFDGQHKTAAQIFLGNRAVPVRVFLNPDKDRLKEANRRAHKELRQVEFFKSVLDDLGQDIFSQHFRRFLEDETGIPKSEKAFIESLEADTRVEMKRNLYHYLKTTVKNSEDPRNEFFDYVELDQPRSKTWPISYDSVEKTFLRHFIDSSPCEAPVDADYDEENDYPRNTERKNLVILMNIVTDYVLREKFDKSLGIAKLEDRIKKGEVIPDNHLRAYRMFRPAVFVVWCEFLKEAIAMYLIAKGKITNDMRNRNRVLWAQMDGRDWEAIAKMIDKLASHKLWIDRGPVISNAFGQTRPEFFRKLLEEGIIDGIGKILGEPINIQYLFNAVGN
ncbi:hypothetical protein HKBW3C_02854 [Candidatus Hakubella thermalkaliphila]|nr:hypothetical protein [Bacillota bacterium]GFP43725.1 hypothetical protein HKBW3C_02854 [Candidatus Hakubella thermalkaliphila]